MISTAEDMAVDLEKIQSLAADAKKFAVLIKDNRMAKAIPKNYSMIADA
jgi:hypothetical protein